MPNPESLEPTHSIPKDMRIEAEPPMYRPLGGGAFTPPEWQTSREITHDIIALCMIAQEEHLLKRTLSEAEIEDVSLLSHELLMNVLRPDANSSSRRKLRAVHVGFIDERDRNEVKSQRLLVGISDDTPGFVVDVERSVSAGIYTEGQDIDTLSETGRGTSILAYLSRALYHQVDHDDNGNPIGKTVWFEYDLSEPMNLSV